MLDAALKTAAVRETRDMVVICPDVCAWKRRICRFFYSGILEEPKWVFWSVKFFHEGFESFMGNWRDEMAISEGDSKLLSLTRQFSLLGKSCWYKIFSKNFIPKIYCKIKPLETSWIIRHLQGFGWGDVAPECYCFVSPEDLGDSGRDVFESHRPWRYLLMFFLWFW